MSPPGLNASLHLDPVNEQRVAVFWTQTVKRPNIISIMSPTDSLQLGKDAVGIRRRAVRERSNFDFHRS